MYNTVLVSLETGRPSSRPQYTLFFSRVVERHLPHPDGRVRTCPRQPPLSDPEDAIDTARNSVHNCDFLRGFPDAPHVYVGVERPGSAVQRVRGPAECVDTSGVEGPAGGDHLALRHVVQYDLAAGLIGGGINAEKKGS